jgi:PEP-CTERM motif
MAARNIRQEDAFMIRFGLIVVIALVLSPVAAPGAPIVYDEAVSGDLSDVIPSATGLAFDAGVNSVRGSVYSGVLAPDFDAFAFSIPAGLSLTAITYTFTLEPDEGNTVATTSWGFDLGNTGLPAELGVTEIDLFGSSPQALFVGALPRAAGLYGFYNVAHDSTQGLDWLSAYQIDFVVRETTTGVPEPASLLLLAAGLAALCGARLGWTRRFARR